MIECVSTNIFESSANVIVHQANCFHTMGAGIAKEIKQRYPEAYEADLLTKKGDSTKLGTFSQAHGKDLRTIVNLYGQYFYGRDKRYTNYEAVYNGLSKVNSTFSRLEHPFIVLAIPYKMGCNNAGGSWRVVSAMIYDIFEDSNLKVLICGCP